MKEEKNRMSVLNNIRGLALINIEDIFRFTLTEIVSALAGYRLH